MSQGADMGETRQLGECGNCATPVILVRNSERPTCRSDGNRYIYPDRPEMSDSGWCIFRCRGCLEVIDGNWRALGGGG